MPYMVNKAYGYTDIKCPTCEHKCRYELNSEDGEGECPNCWDPFSWVCWPEEGASGEKPIVVLWDADYEDEDE